MVTVTTSCPKKSQSVYRPRKTPHREKVQANAQKACVQKASELKETADKVAKVSFNWAKLIARIYEVNPLICTRCGKEIKIIAFVTQSS